MSATGLTALDYAEATVTGQLEAWLAVTVHRLDDPASFPGYPADLSTGAVARRILGALLNAGWTIPAEPPP